MPEHGPADPGAAGLDGDEQSGHPQLHPELDRRAGGVRADGRVGHTLVDNGLGRHLGRGAAKTPPARASFEAADSTRELPTTGAIAAKVARTCSQEMGGSPAPPRCARYETGAASVATRAARRTSREVSLS